MSPITRWNGFWKETNTLAAEFVALRIGKKVADGKGLSEWDQGWLERVNLKAEEVRDMHRLTDTLGDKQEGGHRFAYERRWAAIPGISEQRAATLRSKLVGATTTIADLSIITTDIGNTAAFTDKTETWKIVTQFKRFFLAATVNVTVPMAQRIKHGDPLAMMNLGALIAVGSISYLSQGFMKGEDPLPAIMNPHKYSKRQWWNNVVQLMYESLDRSGAMGIFPEMFNLSERMGIGPSQMFGGEGLSRARSRSVLQILFGPVAGKLDDAATSFFHGMKYLFTDEPMSAHGLRTMRRLLPFNNLLALTLIADAGLSGLDAAAERDKYNRLKGSGAGPDFYTLYYDRFRWAEHRIADAMGIRVDYRNYDRKQAIGLGF